MYLVLTLILISVDHFRCQEIGQDYNNFHVQVLDQSSYGNDQDLRLDDSLIKSTQIIKDQIEKTEISLIRRSLRRVLDDNQQKNNNKESLYNSTDLSKLEFKLENRTTFEENKMKDDKEDEEKIDLQFVFIIIAVVAFVIILAIIAAYINDRNQQLIEDAANNKSFNEMTYQELKKLKEMQMNKLAETRVKQMNQDKQGKIPQERTKRVRNKDKDKAKRKYTQDLEAQHVDENRQNVQKVNIVESVNQDISPIKSASNVQFSSDMGSNNNNRLPKVNLIRCNQAAILENSPPPSILNGIENFNPSSQMGEVREESPICEDSDCQKPPSYENSEASLIEPIPRDNSIQKVLQNERVQITNQDPPLINQESDRTIRDDDQEEQDNAETKLDFQQIKLQMMEISSQQL